jgi:N-acetylmuramoyl-L-alanine amidase
MIVFRKSAGLPERAADGGAGREIVPIPSPSPNFGERRGHAIDMLVLHYTGMPSAEAARRWLCDERSRVSSHYLVDEDGRVFALVAEEKRAWHAGISFWAGERDINSRSVGIEVHNAGHAAGLPPFPDRQLEAVSALSAAIVRRHGVASRRVLAHSDVAPARKIDPGERFPWARLAAAGVGIWVEPAPPDASDVLAEGAQGAPVEALQHSLTCLGYEIDVTGRFDTATRVVLSAFQRHWRPERVDGRADSSTRQALAGVLAHACGS